MSLFKSQSTITYVKFILIATNMLITACASSPPLKPQKVVIENSSGGNELPQWVIEPKVSWEKEDVIFFKSFYSIKGNQRLNGCYDLAKLEMSEAILENMKHEIKGEISLGNEGIAEDADPLITKSISKAFNGTLNGLKHYELAFERYLIQDSERITCYLLSGMNKQDYNKLKISTINQIISVGTDVAGAIRKKQADFFKQNPTNSVQSQISNTEHSETMSLNPDEPRAADKSMIVGE